MDLNVLKKLPLISDFSNGELIDLFATATALDLHGPPRPPGVPTLRALRPLHISFVRLY